MKVVIVVVLAICVLAHSQLIVDGYGDAYAVDEMGYATPVGNMAGYDGYPAMLDYYDMERLRNMMGVDMNDYYGDEYSMADNNQLSRLMDAMPSRERPVRPPTSGDDDAGVDNEGVSDWLKLMCPNADKCLKCATIGSVDVDGQASVKLETNMTRISLGVEYQGDNTTLASTVHSIVSRRAAAVVKVLQSTGLVSELSTTAITLNREYQWIGNPWNQNVFIGYKGTNMVEFVLKGTESGYIIDAVVSAGASRIDSITFEATPAAIRVARDTAMKEALKDARSKAVLIADTMGVSLNIPPRINLGYVSPPPSMKGGQAFGMRAMALEVSMPVADSPLIPGKQEITANVRVTFEFTRMDGATSDRLILPSTSNDDLPIIASSIPRRRPLL